MADAMVTARMSQARKDMGTQALADIGIKPSAAINKLYEYVIAHGDLPEGLRDDSRTGVSADEWAQAIAFVDGIPALRSSRFADMSDDEIKRERMISRGLMEPGDF